MKSTEHRSLSKDELFVLFEVQAIWGMQNTITEVFISKSDEAVLFVKDRRGQMPVMVDLTNLGNWLSDGTITYHELIREIMGPLSFTAAIREMSLPLFRSWIKAVLRIVMPYRVAGKQRRAIINMRKRS